MTINEFRGEFRFLSNFCPAQLVFDGLAYPSAEHAYQAAKTLDEGIREHIAMLEFPGAAKRYGQTLFLRPDWEEVKIQVMADVVAAKFENLRLRSALYNTWGHDLVEGNNWHDQFWGNCTCLAHHDVPGLNMLGNILMAERSR